MPARGNQKIQTGGGAEGWPVGRRSVFPAGQRSWSTWTPSLKGRKIACPELVQACRRFKQDLENPAWDFNPRDAEFVIRIIETTFVHQQGERLDGTPLRGQPFLLEPFLKFIVYNLLGFFLAGTKERRYKEALIYIPRKNIKTSFAAALAWGLALLNPAERV